KKLFAYNVITKGTWSQLLGTVEKVKGYPLDKRRKAKKTFVPFEIPVPDKMKDRKVDIITLSVNPETDVVDAQLNSRPVKGMERIEVRLKVNKDDRNEVLENRRNYVVMIDPETTYSIYIDENPARVGSGKVPANVGGGSELAVGRERELVYLPEITEVIELKHGPVPDVSELSNAAPVRDLLPGILEKTAAYCEKLEQKAFHLFCYEQVYETFRKRIHTTVTRSAAYVEDAPPPVAGQTGAPPRSSLRRRGGGTYLKKNFTTSSRNFVNRYQIIRRGDGIKEQRELSHFDGGKLPPGKSLQKKQSIVYSYENALYPVFYLSGSDREKFAYKLLGETREMGRDSYMIEVRSKKSADNLKAGELLAVAWVDAEDYSILKTIAYPAAFNGYRHLMKSVSGSVETVGNSINVKDVHYFGVQKNGLRFPSRTEIQVEFKPKKQKKMKRPKKSKKVKGKTSGNSVKAALEAKFPAILTSTFYYTDYTFFETEEEPVFKVLAGNVFVDPRPDVGDHTRVVAPVVKVDKPAPDQNELVGVLERTALYCDRLRKQVFHFFCYEKVDESLKREVSFIPLASGSGPGLGESPKDKKKPGKEAVSKRELRRSR
ncbi:MAG: hypothetical protein GY940_25510, partial [bacterium]|nr:hypothetical protein [bacterium]